MVKLKELLTEGIDTANDFVPEIEKVIKKHFPKSFVQVYHSTKLSSSIHIQFAVGGKKDWANGIWQNDISWTSMLIFGFDDIGDIPGKLEFSPNQAGSFVIKPAPGSHMAYDRIKVPVRKKTGTPEAILKSIDKYFGDLKKSLKANKNNLSSSHEYVKKYI